MSKRVGCFINGDDPEKELKAGVHDISRMYNILTNEKFGACDRILSRMYGNVKNKKEFCDILYDTLETLEPTDQLIFYFSGHGENRASIYHLRCGKDLISFEVFLHELKSAEVSRAIIILDACFSGRATGAKNTNSEILLPITLPEGIAILASSTEDQYSYEKEDKTISIFTDLLCECIETGNGEQHTDSNHISIEDAHKYIKKNGKKHGDKQHPKYKVENAKEAIWISKNITLKEELIQPLLPLVPSGGNMSDVEKINYDNEEFLEKANTAIKANDLDWDLIKEYSQYSNLKLDFSLEQDEILNKINFLQHGRIKNVIVLNFAHSPHLYIPQAQVTVIIEDKYNLKRFHGAIIKLLNDVLEYITNNIDRYYYKKNGKRIDDYIVPEDVIREALSNALVHRCYENCNEVVKVKILKKEEKIIITSPGSFLGDSEKMLMSNEDNDYTHLRYASLNNYIFGLGSAELIGTGFDYFRAYIEKEGKNAVEFKHNENSTSIVLKFQKRNTIKENIGLTNISNHIIPKTLTPTLGVFTNFIGREVELKELETKLTGSNSLLLLNGIAGIGKSSLAAYYLNTQKDNYHYYGFVEASEGIKEAFISAFATSLNLNKDKSIDHAFDEIILILRNLEGKKLLIIDDIRNISKNEQTIKTISTLLDNNFTLLLTSRETMENISQFYLQTMNQIDARKLFLQWYPTDELEQVDKILEYLDNHTLFIEMTAKTLRKRNATLNLKNLLEKFQKGEFSSIKKDKKESFDKLLNNLFAKDPILQDTQIITLLQKLTLLPSIEIYFEKIYKFLVCNKKELLEESLNELVDNGWLVVRKSNYKLHQIMKEYILANHTPTYDIIEGIVEYFNAMIDNSANPQTAVDVRDDLVYFESVVAILTKLEIENEVIANFYERLGNIYLNLGKYSKALVLFENGLQIRQKILGENHKDTAESYNSLGNVEYSRGNYPQAIESYKKSLTIKLKILGEEHQDTATTYNNLGLAYDAQGNYSNAINYYEKSLVIYKETVGEEHPSTAITYSSLGLAYNAQGDYSHAVKYYEKSLAIYLKTYGEKHSSIAIIYNHLGKSFRAQGNYSEAINYYEKSLEITLKTLGEENPFTATVYNNIGSVWEAKSNYMQAISYYEKTLTIYLKTLGEEHPSTATTYNNLGGLYYQMAEYSKAFEYMEKAINIREKTLPANHPYLKSSKEALEIIKAKL